jgi:hypothetical protein
MRAVLSEPTAKTFVGEVPHTLYRLRVVPLVIAAQLDPSQRIMVPLSPTAYTFVGDVPQTACSCCVVPLVIAAQLVPSKRRIVPPSPTA